MHLHHSWESLVQTAWARVTLGRSRQRKVEGAEREILQRPCAWITPEKAAQSGAVHSGEAPASVNVYETEQAEVAQDTRGDPVGLAGRRLSRSAKVSL